MKILIEVKPNEDRPSNWYLVLLEGLNEFLEDQPLEDFHIEINEANPCVVDWKAEKVTTT